MDAFSSAERNGVRGAVAEDDGALDPAHLAVRLAAVRVRGEGIVAGGVGASGDEVAGDAADVGVAHDNAVLACRDPVGEGLGVGGCPLRPDGDGH